MALRTDDMIVCGSSLVSHQLVGNCTKLRGRASRHSACSPVFCTVPTRRDISNYSNHRSDFAEEPGDATYLVVGNSLLLHRPPIPPAARTLYTVLSFRFGAQSQRVDYPESMSHDLARGLKRIHSSGGIYSRGNHHRINTD